MRTAVLDLGSNSFHILVADVGNDGDVVPVLREREMLHLGAVVATHGHIPTDDLERATSLVGHFVELAHRTGADTILPVATSALRDATNGGAAIDALSEAAGRTVRVLEGDIEARLGYRGVRASVAIRQDPVLVLDLGGGSLELAVGSGPDVAWAASTNLGVSRLAAELVENDPPKGKEVKRLRQRVADELAPLTSTLRDLAPVETVAIGGTIRAIARIVAADLHDWMPASINQFPLRAEQVARWRDKLNDMPTEDRAGVKAMKSRRADRLHVAATILAETLDVLGVEQVTISDWGLREGVVLEAAGITHSPYAEQLRELAVQRLRESFVPDDPHLPHVAKLAVKLFDGTGRLHELGPRDRLLLRYAALLHDLGESLALRGHHKHGAYIIEHSEIRGFSPGELGMLTSLVRFHKSRGISSGFPAYEALSSDRQERVRKLLALLQLADGLDRARDQAVRDVRLTQDNGGWQAVLHGEGLHTALAEVDRKTALFERTFGVEVSIVDTVDQEP